MLPVSFKKLTLQETSLKEVSMKNSSHKHRAISDIEGASKIKVPAAGYAFRLQELNRPYPVSVFL